MSMHFQNHNFYSMIINEFSANHIKFTYIIKERIMGFFKWHKRQTEWWKKKLKISDYVLMWLGFFKGLVFGLLIYHFFIN